MNEKELNGVRTMQLATASTDGRPWVCSVYFVVSQGNFYWLSYPERRHSQELAANPRAAITVAIHQELPVVGLQAEGEVHIVKQLGEATRVLAAYVKKYGKGTQFIELLKRGNNHHQLYCLVPGNVMLFDERTPHKSPQ